MERKAKKPDEMAYENDPIFEEGGTRTLAPKAAAPLALIKDLKPMITRYHLVQPVSQRGNTPGLFWNSFSEEELDTLTIIPQATPRRAPANRETNRGRGAGEEGPVLPYRPPATAVSVRR